MSCALTRPLPRISTHNLVRIRIAARPAHIAPRITTPRPHSISTTTTTMSADKAPVPVVLCGKSPTLAKGFMSALGDTGYDGPSSPLPPPSPTD